MTRAAGEENMRCGVQVCGECIGEEVWTFDAMHVSVRPCDL